MDGAQSPSTLGRIFSTYRWRILLTYGLTLLENVFELLYPFATGVAINGLLSGNYSSLLLLLSVWSAHLISGTFRKVYDTYIFTGIYSDVATAVVLEQGSRGVPTTQIVARSALSREFVDFFERDLPLISTTLIGFAGALVMLFSYDVRIGFYCLAALAPLLVLNGLYARRSQELNKSLNDQLEREVDVLTARRPEVVRTHYTLLANWRMRLSNAEAANWGVMELFVIGLAAAVLIRAVALPGAQAGDIYAVIAYLWSYIGSLDNVPFTVQQLSRLRDLGYRMHFNTEDQ
ncbi:MAG: ABC transporter six-transmembrane domain-containing protein [Gemmatimonadaceae bacterium]